MSTIKSPCILVCSIDQASGHCHGCGRTGDEIANWLAFSEEVRDVLMTDILPERVSKLEKRPRRITKRTRQRIRNGETPPKRDILDL